MSLYPEVGVLVQPNLHAGPVLEIAEDQVDGLDHHLLHLGALERHFGGRFFCLLFARGEITQNVWPKREGRGRRMKTSRLTEVGRSVRCGPLR